jgi:hypothetical protein
MSAGDRRPNASWAVADALYGPEGVNNDAFVAYSMQPPYAAPSALSKPDVGLSY